MKRISIILVTLLASIAINAKTLIVYYSFTNNVHTIVTDLQAQTGADAVRIEPAEEGLDYAADNYAIGSSLISAIRKNPDKASSYPEIKPQNVNLDDYDMVIIAAPLWWSQMAAPLQTYLFNNREKMSGKKIGLIVSSASSGISGVEADARRLIPAGDFITPSLWIRSSQTSNCHSMIADWLKQIEYDNMTSQTKKEVINISVNGHSLTARLNDNSSACALTELLKNGPVSIHAHEYGDFEMVGSLPKSLPVNDTDYTTRPGDIILYQGNNICFYYGVNTWDFTPLGSIDNADNLDLKSIFGVESGSADFILSLGGAAGLDELPADCGKEIVAIHGLDGRMIHNGNIQSLDNGIYIVTERNTAGQISSRKVNIGGN